MIAPPVLRGMTWNHPRGVDPLVAHARLWEQTRDVRVTWEARSLEDFEAFPLDELAGKYDLMVIDHPHVGMAAVSGCLLPFDPSVHFDTVGLSHESYFYAGKQWALAIDAAAQVAARRAGSLDRWPATWDEVTELARDGRVLWPLAPVHALMSFMTMCANAGHPCRESGDELLHVEVGERILARLRELASLVSPICFEMNPIAAFERMIAEERFVYAPLIYGYVSYARDGFRPTRLEFGDIPSVRGSTLGGTGIAVSAQSRHRDAAVEVALDLASAATQRGIYATSGGQPAHREAWISGAVNAETHDFYRDTLATLDASHIRPRFDGYIAFQQSAGQLVGGCLRGATAPDQCMRDLNRQFREAQKL